jgi:GPH family glycoside/pentoside/hexuronide:cation symporter
MTETSSGTIEAVAVDRSAKLPFFTKVSYSCGAVSEVILGNIIIALALQIYNVGLGVDIRLVGLAISIPRIWDAFSDPIVANISDNYHSRFGRRKPFILVGIIFCGLFCVLMWWPPLAISKNMMFVYFLVFSLLYFTAYTVFGIPYHALGAELTSDYKERIRLMTYKTAFMSIGGLLFLPWLYKLCLFFGKNAPEGVNDEVIGVRTVAILASSVFIFFAIFPSIFCKERFAKSNKEKIAIWPAIKHTMKNKPFLIVCLLTVSTVIGTYIVQPLGFYINLAYISPGDKDATATMIAWYSTTYASASLISVPLIGFLATRWEKKMVLFSGLTLTLIGAVVSWFVFDPKMPYLQVVHAAVAAPGMVCLWQLTAVMIADVCDLDELGTGLRREGMYTAVFGWFMKLAYSLTPTVGAFIVSWSAYNAKETIQLPQTVLKLRASFALIPILFLMAALYFTNRYSLNHKKMDEIQAKLIENRKNRSE